MVSFGPNTWHAGVDSGPGEIADTDDYLVPLLFVNHNDSSRVRVKGQGDVATLVDDKGNSYRRMKWTDSIGNIISGYTYDKGGKS